MENLFVPYEIAKQLKEKGFNEQCLSTYTWNGIKTTYDTLTCISENPQTIKERLNKNNDKYTCSAPMWQQVVDWLREEKNIQINIVWNKFYPVAPYEWEVRPTWRDEPVRPYGMGGRQSTYYKSLERAINQALQFIIENGTN
jgi:hypothetical protein